MDSPLEIHTVCVTKTGSGLATHDPAYLSCIIASVETSADYIEVYNGRDATSGTKIMKLKVLANRSVAFNISRELLCDRGIYISCSVSTVEWSVFFHVAPHGTGPVLESG